MIHRSCQCFSTGWTSIAKKRRRPPLRAAHADPATIFLGQSHITRRKRRTGTSCTSWRTSKHRALHFSKNWQCLCLRRSSASPCRSHDQNVSKEKRRPSRGRAHHVQSPYSGRRTSTAQMKTPLEVSDVSSVRAQRVRSDAARARVAR